MKTTVRGRQPYLRQSAFYDHAELPAFVWRSSQPFFINEKYLADLAVYRSGISSYVCLQR